MFAWLLLYVYVLGDVLDFVIAISGWCFQIHISLQWLGGGLACCAYPQNVLM